ncbi:hypothetical protein acsn021_16650 [Anaerocolumna cellulosilytica]|uniref:Uncharacterized protein n=1 Tax=Anaerocolumna cellulosilytica TaxID=433286 RepID=A0A6S6QWJ6_9FIRM|nr:hypothetical protein acsn021_16650 [Anaerocolumna cellulosilytica]
MIFFKDKPLQTATANASIDKPTARINNSNKLIANSPLDIILGKLDKLYLITQLYRMKKDLPTARKAVDKSRYLEQNQIDTISMLAYSLITILIS